MVALHKHRNAYTLRWGQPPSVPPCRDHQSIEMWLNRTPHPVVQPLLSLATAERYGSADMGDMGASMVCTIIAILGPLTMHLMHKLWHASAILSMPSLCMLPLRTF